MLPSPETFDEEVCRLPQQLVNSLISLPFLSETYLTAVRVRDSLIITHGCPSGSRVGSGAADGRGTGGEGCRGTGRGSHFENCYK